MSLGRQHCTVKTQLSNVGFFIRIMRRVRMLTERWTIRLNENVLQRAQYIRIHVFADLTKFPCCQGT